MSKERELLKRWFNDIGIIQADIKLLRDTQALLAQPEQEPSSDDYMYNKLKEDYEYLLSHPPKREPLSDEAVCEILIKKEWKGFVELVRLVEKEHGITGGG